MVLHDKPGNFCVIFLLKALSSCTRGYNWTCAWTLGICHSHAAEWPTVETSGSRSPLECSFLLDVVVCGVCGCVFGVCGVWCFFSSLFCAWGQPGDGTVLWCRGCAEGSLLLPLSPWPSLILCCVHLSLSSGFAGWDRRSWGIPHPSKSHLFATFLLSSPALLQVGACPVLMQSSCHKAKVWGCCRFGLWRHFELLSARDLHELPCLTALPGRAAGANRSFHTSALSCWKENWKWQLLPFPVFAHQGLAGRWH